MTNDNFSIADIQADPQYLNSLSFEDLKRLREIVRMRQFQQLGRMPTDRECDQMIASLGPQIIEKYIKMQVDAKLSR